MLLRHGSIPQPSNQVRNATQDIKDEIQKSEGTGDINGRHAH